jgi:hypothetical protein
MLKLRILRQKCVKYIVQCLVRKIKTTSMCQDAAKNKMRLGANRILNMASIRLTGDLIPRRT